MEQSNWETPDCRQWIDRLDGVVEDCPGSVIIVAHSLGCLAFAHWASFAGERVRRKVEGALLVAPADVERANSPEEIRGFSPAPTCRMPVPTMVIASENDPCMSFARARQLAAFWESVLVNAGTAGHINVASGHGPWPMGITLLDGFMRDLAAPVLETSRKHR